MKGFARGVLCAVLTLVLCVPCTALDVSASGAVLLDAASGRVLWEHNAHEKRYIASITKLMTALVAMESGHGLEEMVDIKREYTGAEGSSMYLKEGERLSLEALLYGLLLASGNDAALAVAGHCAGSVDAFVERMNRKAARLGMTNTRFLNPSGLTQEGHVSTAADMAKLAAACMQDETIAKIVATRSITIGGRTFTNHNKLLWRYDGCVGMKTGYTERAGRTLISCARRDGRLLVAVTLNAPDDWQDHTKMLDYGFSAYTNTELSKAGTVRAKQPVFGSLVSFIGVEEGVSLSYPLKEGEQVRREVSLVRWTKAPVIRGQTAGTVTYYLGNQIIGICPLLYGDTAPLNTAPEGKLLQRLGTLLGFS